MTMAMADEESCEVCKKESAVRSLDTRAPINGRTRVKVCVTCHQRLTASQLMPRPDMPRDPRAVSRALRPPLASPKLQD